MDDKISSLLEQLQVEAKNNPNSVIALHRLGLAYWRAERYDEAVAAFQKALEIDPYSFEIRSNLGVLYLQMGRLEEGIAENQNALEIYPEATEAMVNIGSAYIQQQNWEGALKYLQMAIEKKSDMVPALTNLVTVLIALNRIDEAIDVGKKAVSLAPTFGLAHNNLAVALYHKGDKAGALQHAMKAKAAGHPVQDDFLAKLKTNS